MKVIMRNGTIYEISDERGKKLQTLLTTGIKKPFINLDGQGITVSPSAISELVLEKDYVRAEHLKKGDLECKNGHFRPKHEAYCQICNVDAKEVPTSFIHQAPTGDISTTAKRWMEAIRRNMTTLKNTGKYGTLRAEDLEESYGKEDEGSEGQVRQPVLANHSA